MTTAAPDVVLHDTVSSPVRQEIDVADDDDFDAWPFVELEKRHWTMPVWAPPHTLIESVSMVAATLKTCRQGLDLVYRFVVVGPALTAAPSPAAGCPAVVGLNGGMHATPMRHLADNVWVADASDMRVRRDGAVARDRAVGVFLGSFAGARMTAPEGWAVFTHGCCYDTDTATRVLQHDIDAGSRNKVLPRKKWTPDARYTYIIRGPDTVKDAIINTLQWSAVDGPRVATVTLYTPELALLTITPELCRALRAGAFEGDGGYNPETSMYFVRVGHVRTRSKWPMVVDTSRAAMFLQGAHPLLLPLH